MVLIAMYDIIDGEEKQGKRKEDGVMKKTKKLLSAILCGTLMFTGVSVFDCGYVSAAASGTDVNAGIELSTAENETVNTYVVGEDTLPYTDEQLYEQLFDIHNKIDISLDMSNEEMAKLESDYEKNSSSPIYRMGNITFTITQEDGTKNAYLIKEVGIRMKGNMTRNKFFNKSTNQVYDLIHYKISFKETFDDVADGYGENEYYLQNGESTWKTTEEGKAARKARKNRVFAGMEKLDLKWNGNYDNTYLREYYAYKLYRSEGIWAPQMNLASMDFGDVSQENVYHLGVYSIHECVDEVFINRYLTNEEDQGGDLYKAAWAGGGADFTPSTSVGISDDFTGKGYNYDLKTNKKTSDFSAIKNVINTLSSNDMTKEKFSSVVDTDSFMKFAAVSYFLGNPDDIRNNYNNYYAYVYPATSKKAGKVALIPYDYDRCLGVTIGWNPDRTGMTGVSPDSTYAEGAGRGQKNPLYIYGTAKNGLFKDEYDAALKEVYDNELFTTEAFEKDYKVVENLYANDAAVSDNLKLADYNSSAGGGKWTAAERIAKFVFTMADDQSTEDYTSSRSNITVENYINAIKKIYNDYINTVNPEEGYYIGTVANKWLPSKDYKMEYSEKDGTYNFTWKVDSQTVFVVVHTDGAEYRYSSITGSVPKGVGTNLAGAIVLDPGTYVIKINDSTKKVSISLQGSEVADIKLTLNANGGKIGSTSTKSKTVQYGKKIGTLKTPERKGYTFAGWYTKKSGGSRVTASTKCTYKKNTTLYAHWTKVNPGKVTFKKVSNSASKTATVTLTKLNTASGYRIEYSLNKKFTSKKTINTKKTTVKISGLKKGKTYYVRVSAYANDSTRAKVYGTAVTKSVKITK